MSRRGLVAAVLIAMAAVAAVPAAAQAASSVPTSTIASTRLPKTAPVYDVQLWPTKTGSAIIVDATVTTETPLPVRVRIPLPEGARVDWVGEILGQTAAEDIASTYRLVDGGKILEMVLTTSRIAQVEATYAAPTLDRDLLVSKLVWIQSVPASLVRFATMVPADLKDVTVTPVSKYAPEFNASGERLYVVDERKMDVGDEYTFSVSFSAGTGAAGSASGQQDSRSTLLLVLVAGVAVAVGALVFVMRRQASVRG